MADDWLEEPELLEMEEPEMEPEAPEVPSRDDLLKRLESLGLYIRSLYDRFDGSNTRAKALEDAEESRRCYEMESEATDWPWPGASNMVTPMTRIAVDEMEPRLVSAVVGREPYIKVAPYEGTSTKSEADQVQEYVNIHLKRKVGIEEVVADAIHELLLDGTVFYLPAWFAGTNSAKVYLVPMDHVWLPDNVDDDDWERVPVIRYVDEYSLYELRMRALQEDGWVIENVAELEASQEEKLFTTQQEASDVQDYEDELLPELQSVQCLEAYLTYIIEDEVGPENLIVMVERETFKVLRVRRQVEVFSLDEKLLQRLTIFRKRGVSWGNPIYKNIKGIQEGMDAMWNRCINSADITMTPWGFVRRGMSGSLRNRIQVTPGVLAEVDDPEAFVFPNLGAFNPTSFVPLIMQYVNFFQRLTVSDFMQGQEDSVSGKKGTTATGTLAILQEGKIKHEYRGMRIHQQFLRMFITIHNLVADNMNPQDAMMLTGAPITKDMMSKAYMFDIGGSSSTANKFIDRKEHEDFLMTVQPFMSLMNPQRLIMDHLEVYDKKPVAEYLDPELNALIQSYLMQKQNERALEQWGLRPEVAKEAAAMGVTPDTAKEFIKQAVAIGTPEPPTAEGGPSGA